MATQLISEETRGVFPIAATPFSEDGSVDFESIDSLVDFYLESGAHGLTILGMMGEAHKLSDVESTEVIGRFMRRIDRRVPVVVGVSSPSMLKIADLSKTAMDEGCAGVMITPMSGLKTEAQVLGYFDAVFDALGPEIPVCLQDYPTVTGVHLSNETLLKLIDDHPSIVMLKHEDFPGLRKLTEVRRHGDRPDARGISILVANAGLYYPIEMRRGADGVMTGFAFPDMLVKVYDLFASGEADAAEDLYDLYLPLLRYEYQPGIGLALRKEILCRRGAIRCTATRSPGPALNRDEHAELTVLMDRLQRKLGG